MGPGEREQGRQCRGAHDHGYAEWYDPEMSTGLAEWQFGMEEIVDGEHEQQHAAGNLKISDGHPEKMQDGVADQQKAEPNGRGRHRRFEHQPPTRGLVERHTDSKIDQDNGDDVHGDEEWDKRQEQRSYHCTLGLDRKSTRLNSSHLVISYAVFCLKKKKKNRENCE